MKFGNWNVTATGIEWAGQELQRFVINRQNLTETITVEKGKPQMYKWILLAIEEDWLTEDDLYDLNFAFVYAVAQAGVDFDYQIFDDTLMYQFGLLDEEEEEQPSFGDQANDVADAEQQRKDALSERD